MALHRSRERRARRAIQVAATCVALVASGCAATGSAPPDLGDAVEEAYEYAFPLYELSRHRWNALEKPGSRTATTLNAFAHSRALPGPDDIWANAPSEDVLYSTAWLDLARGPAHLDTPDTGDRFYVLTLIDFYSNTFFYAGERTTGTRAQKYFVVGPDWRGQAPAGATLVRASTNDVYVNLRIQTEGLADQVAANAVQDGFRFTPAQPGGPPGPERIRPVGGDPENYLDVVNQMLALDPPPAEERGLVDRFREVGICGSECSWDRLPAATKASWEGEFPELGRYFERLEKAGRASGWIDYSPPGNLLGTAEQKDYDLRAMALATGGGMLGMSREEANYWMTFTDATNAPLRGAQNYALRLPPGGIPSKAFWSITLYEVREHGQFPTPNSIGRYVISSETRDLVTNPDGSIDIAVQATEPAQQPANWLPSPSNGKNFILFARSYVPGSEVLAGEFTMPLVSSR